MSINVLILGSCTNSCCIPNPEMLSSENKNIKAKWVRSDTSILKDSSKMAEYDCIVFGCHQLKGTGDGFADCIDNGIPVILCNYSLATSYAAPQGRFLNEKYAPHPPTSYSGGTYSTTTLKDTEFSRWFDDFEFPSSCNAFVNPGGVREEEGVVIAATGNLNGSTVPMISVRVDKEALVIGLNAYIYQSSPHMFKVLAKCVEIATQYVQVSDEFFDDTIKTFALHKRKNEFTQCSEIVERLNIIVKRGDKNTNSMTKISNVWKKHWKRQKEES
eukprot:UN33025